MIRYSASRIQPLFHWFLLQHTGAVFLEASARTMTNVHKMRCYIPIHCIPRRSHAKRLRRWVPLQEGGKRRKGAVLRTCGMVVFVMCLLAVNLYFIFATDFLNKFLFSCGKRCDGVPLREDVESRDVDLVISWVDGSDPAWLTLKEEFLPEKTDTRDAQRPKRWRNNNEVCYLLRSVKQYAPWIHHVWIVSLNQIPVCVDTSATTWISVVNHSDFMREIDQPNFSSHSIEANLHRIPGLSEFFLYNNDDMLFLQRLEKEDIFTWDGKMRFYIYGWKQLQHFLSLWSSHVHTYCVQETAKALFRRFPGVFPHKQMHQSLVMSKTLLEETWKLFPEEMNKTSIAKFRDIHTVIPLTLAFETGLALDFGLKDYTDKQILLKLKNKASDENQFAMLNNVQPKWLCVNDDSNQESPVNWRLVAFLRKEFPIAGEWEPPLWEDKWLSSTTL
ncbi:exopolysaccharide phosphotransferase [Pelomyxa schiedti]|nr:exopolysaccharide phosphotransferase [Pelomyxa schiedti]